MKKISDYIGTKTAIWIDKHTIEQENAIKELLLKDGRITRWCGGSEKLNEYIVFDMWDKLQYCLCIDSDSLHVKSKSEAISVNFQIIPASEFLPPKFEYLEEIEVSDCEKFNNPEVRKYIATLPNGNIVALCENERRAVNWRYARKINHERTEAIDTIKSLMQQHNISKDEIS